jgi:hypothetical protein
MKDLMVRMIEKRIMVKKETRKKLSHMSAVFSIEKHSVARLYSARNRGYT